jgi:hypothetical protein
MTVSSVMLFYVQVRLHFPILMCKLYFNVNLLLLDFVRTAQLFQQVISLLSCLEVDVVFLSLGNIWGT